MAGDNSEEINYDETNDKTNFTIKLICLGDSAVGKSKLVERFLVQDFKPIQMSTYALNLMRHETVVDNEPITVDIWDTAGQEMFQSMHSSYYHQAHACVLVFDATRKVTYRNLTSWYRELRQYRPNIPVFCAANKIDVNVDASKRSYNFAEKMEIPLYFVSASDGTNVIKLFRDAIAGGVKYKKNPSDINDQIMEELERH